MLTRFKTNGDFVYVNPDRVFEVRKCGEESSIIWSDDDKNYVIVDEPIDQVAMRLNDAMRR